MLFTCIKSRFFRNHLANFHQISHWSFCWNVIDSLFNWSCFIDCQAHIFLFKTKNCSNDDIFISCDDRIGKMLHNICMFAVAMSLRWANRGPWASCLHILWFCMIHLSSRIILFISGKQEKLKINMKNMIRELPGNDILEKNWILGHSWKIICCHPTILSHFSQKTPKWVIGEQCRPRSDATECSIWSESTLFALVTGISIKHSNDKNLPYILLLKIDWSKEL